VRLRQVCVPRVAWKVRVSGGPGAIGSQGAETVSRFDCRREPPIPAITSPFPSPARWASHVVSGTSPAVKTSNPYLTPRGARSAVGGIPAWVENPGCRASHFPTLLPFAGVVCANLCERVNAKNLIWTQE
jgi:hypothetical protein